MAQNIEVCNLMSIQTRWFKFKQFESHHLNLWYEINRSSAHSVWFRDRTNTRSQLVLNRVYSGWNSFQMHAFACTSFNLFLKSVLDIMIWIESALKSYVCSIDLNCIRTTLEILGNALKRIGNAKTIGEAGWFQAHRNKRVNEQLYLNSCMWTYQNRYFKISASWSRISENSETYNPNLSILNLSSGTCDMEKTMSARRTFGCWKIPTGFSVC